METIIAAAITAGVTLAVCLITNHAQAEKTRALLDYRLGQLEKKQDMLTMMEIWFVVRVVLYLQYDTSKDFLQQFQYNAENLLKLLDDIPRLKRMVRHAR